MQGAVDLPDPRSADGAGRVDLRRSLALPTPDARDVKQRWACRCSISASSAVSSTVTMRTSVPGLSGTAAAGPAAAGRAAAGPTKWIDSDD